MQTKVLDSRLHETSNQVKRRRKCLQCAHRFTTLEVLQLQLPRVVKQDGSRESFSENKLRQGISIALEKRFISADKIEEAIQQLFNEIKNSSATEISSAQIGEMALKMLKELDKIAYIRFASVYGRFNTIDDFIDLIKNLTK